MAANGVSLSLDGYSLDPETLYRVSKEANNPHADLKISLSSEAQKRISESQKFVEEIATGDASVYGINTGFGKFAEVKISSDKLQTLQKNIILSHCCGVGKNLDRSLVLSMWLMRLNIFCRGHSGIRLSTVERIIQLLELGVLANVPEKGSVGASGDLAPSAHASAILIGEGDCSYFQNGNLIQANCNDALNFFNITRIKLAPKEGLALINGTQLTTALAVNCWAESWRALKLANFSLALAIEGLRGTHQVTHELVIQSKNQPGAVACNHCIKQWLGESSEIHKSHENCGKVQDPYSLRCAPQVHGAIFQDLNYAKENIFREINSSTDNPLLFAKEKLSLSGGNFHAVFTARACDLMCSAMTTLSSISERRTALAMNKESSGLPSFLVEDGGLNSGYMMSQVTAAALVSESKSLSFPASVDSIPTSADQEDHVSMGPIAGQKALRVVENTKRVIAIEICVMNQALELLAPLKSSPAIEKALSVIRKTIPKLVKDRLLYKDLDFVFQLIEETEWPHA